MRRGGKRGQAAAEQDGVQKLKVLHCNIHGFTSKQESLNDVLEKVNPDICNLNEIGLRGNKKFKIKKKTMCLSIRIEKQSRWEVFPLAIRAILGSI